MQQRLIGTPIHEAREYCRTYQIPHRTVKSDGQPHIVTRDHKPGRLNFTVEHGVVTKISKG
jgi:hypothetical protein